MQELSDFALSYAVVPGVNPAASDRTCDRKVRAGSPHTLAMATQQNQIEFRPAQWVQAAPPTDVPDPLRAVQRIRAVVAANTLYFGTLWWYQC
jgi:hypothetical protein